jgi:hypothetical protein
MLLHTTVTVNAVRRRVMNANRGKRAPRLSGYILAFALLAMVTTVPVSAIDPGGVPFTPDPKTTYASEFIGKCDGQQWFMDMVEAALNTSARSINTLTGRSELNAITSLAREKHTEEGSLPPAIGEFVRLRFLFLGNIGLTGDIPDELYACTELENLDLSGNALTGEISSDISRLTKLKTLLLHGNDMTGSIPAFPASLTNLDLSNNALTGGIPASVGTLTNLTVLGLSGNPLGGGIPTELGSLTSLRILLAHDCGLSGGIPAALGSLTDLQVIDLSDNIFDGAIPEAYNGLTKLRALVLDGNKLSGEIPDIWGAMADIELCYLRGNQLVGDAPLSLVTLQTTGTDVRVDQNYLRGENTAELTHNAGNFTSDATQDYQVKMALDAYTRSPVGAKFNVYSAFAVKRADNGNTVQKAKLPPGGYEVVLKSPLSNPAEYFSLTSDANGLYIELLKPVAYDDAIEFELRMLPHDEDAPYTFTSFKLGTETSPSGSTGIGGGTGADAEEPESTPTPTPTQESEPEPSERHAPYLNGYPDGTVQPDGNMTREQTAAIIYRILGEEYAKYDGQYPDVTSDRWSAEAIAYVSAQGIMQGYEDGEFRPSGNITRAEFAAVLVRLKGYAPVETDAFTDVTGHWANGYIGAAETNGLVRGYPDGSFKPNGHITRAEVVTAINRMLGRTPDAEHIRNLVNPYSDLPETHWAYADILEATVEHGAAYTDGDTAADEGGAAR